MANSQMSDHGDKYTKKEKKGILERKKNREVTIKKMTVENCCYNKQQRFSDGGVAL